MTLGAWKTGSPRRTIYVDYNSITKKGGAERPTRQSGDHLGLKDPGWIIIRFWETAHLPSPKPTLTSEKCWLRDPLQAVNLGKSLSQKNLSWGQKRASEWHTGEISFVNQPNSLVDFLLL